MSVPKAERNALMLELNKKGYSYRQIFEELQKKGFSGLKGPKSVGMQLSRLRVKEGVSTSPRKRVDELTSPRQPVSPGTEKMAFWLDRDIKEKLKILAVKERRTASDIVREVLRKYLKNR